MKWENKIDRKREGVKKVNEQHHGQLVAGIAAQFKEVLEQSTQGVYLYLDDVHKVCNKRFSDLLGYESPRQWADTEAPLADVVSADQAAVVRAYNAAVKRFKATRVSLKFRNIATHRTMKRQMIIIPVPFQGHIFTAQFIDKA